MAVATDPARQLSQLKTLCEQAERLRDIAEKLCHELDERMHKVELSKRRSPGAAERRKADRRNSDRRERR